MTFPMRVSVPNRERAISTKYPLREEAWLHGFVNDKSIVEDEQGQLSLVDTDLITLINPTPKP